MVDVNKIQHLLEKHCVISGEIQINPQTGVVDVQGHVKLKETIPVDRLPVSFGHVAGDFYCSRNSLTSLQGAPTQVGGDFWCHRNSLTSLQGAPTHVGGYFYCSHNSLTSLQGAPTHVGGNFACNHNSLTSLQGAPTRVDGMVYISYNPQLPMLRLLTYDQLIIYEAPDVVKEILNKYAGEGRKAMLNCALDLKQAGYVGNARWE